MRYEAIEALTLDAFCDYKRQKVGTNTKFFSHQLDNSYNTDDSKVPTSKMDTLTKHGSTSGRNPHLIMPTYYHPNLFSHLTK